MAKTRTIEQQEALNEQLFKAVRNYDVPAIKQTLHDGADINAEEESKFTPLHLAAVLGHTNAIKALLEAGADVNTPNQWRRTPLHYAANNGHTDAAKVLLAAGADLTLQDIWDSTPITEELMEKHKKLAEYLQSIADAPVKRPMPESVGLDMGKRNAALGLPESTTKPVVGEHTAKVLTGMEAQRQAALNDPGEGI